MLCLHCVIRNKNCYFNCSQGFYFLYYLQQLVGGPDVFQPFLRAYLEEFKFKTASSEQFRAFFTKAFANVPAAQSVDWETWL